MFILFCIVAVIGICAIAMYLCEKGLLGITCLSIVVWFWSGVQTQDMDAAAFFGLLVFGGLFWLKWYSESPSNAEKEVQAAIKAELYKQAEAARKEANFKRMFGPNA